MASLIAQNLRKNLTDAEKQLWSILQRQQLKGYRFRRQAPIGPYVADSFCPSQKLIIEVDGGQHDARLEQDALRTQWLEDRGYRVLRFWNNEVLRNSAGVVELIRKSLSDTPLPNPPPPWGLRGCPPQLPPGGREDKSDSRIGRKAYK
ncbi:MAG: endonuclease domain-containing protein [Rhodospirillales bacterium]|nr:endonuclease domain-containing protein [Rhodospirillales bacterium]